ncbi:MAG: cell division protein ZapD [Thiotrichales bacterium]|nr:MAG: cell division protein ZapD [Thiotrichales bacterium]
MTDYLTYEQPLNERIRTFLRLESLFKQFKFHVKHGSTWDNPIAIDAITDILSFTTRSDIKLEVLKELERQHSRLERLAKRPQIDQSQLSSLLGKQTELIGKLQSSTGQLGQETQSAELLNAVRQKNSVPGPICDFDLPAFHFWLTRAETTRREHLQQWYSPFTVLEEAITTILDVLRNSSDDTEETAAKGFFQKVIDTNQAVQLVHIAVPATHECYPEISAGKHRFSVRFMVNPNPYTRPEQFLEDVDFRLRICSV